MTDTDTALRWHLQYNHYPPVNLVFLDTAKHAIEYANEGRWDQAMAMPNGLIRSVADIIEGLHLDAFLDDQGEKA